METSGGIRASLAGRYASALFDLARDERQIDSVSASLDTLEDTLTRSPELRAVTVSPMVSRSDAGKAVAATAAALKLDSITTRFLGVLAQGGRLRNLSEILRLFRQLAAEHRGEATAQVVSARALDADQVEALKAQLRTRAGREVRLEASVDPSILGGIVVRLGSQMIDASIRTKLNTLATAMKG